MEIGTQFVKFSMIGILNTGIHYGIFIILFRLLGINYLLASTLGYSAGILNSFFFNKRWTFKAYSGRNNFEFIKFVVVNIASLLINIGILKFFVSILHILPEIGQVFAIGCSVVMNFIGNKFWTFQADER